MFTTTDLKSIGYDRVTRDYMASYDGNVIGFFPNYSAAEEALDDYVLSLCEQGLIDQPLAALADDPPQAPPVDDGPADNWGGFRIPDADWGAYATGEIEMCACGCAATVLLHGVHDTLDIALCDGCYAAYLAQPTPAPELNYADIIRTSALWLLARGIDACTVCGDAHRPTQCPEIAQAMHAVNLNDAPTDPEYTDGCGLIVAGAAAVTAVVLAALLRS